MRGKYIALWGVLVSNTGGSVGSARVHGILGPYLVNLHYNLSGIMLNE